jgi:hypothetical protein
MSTNPLAGWHQLIKEGKPQGLDALLAEQVVFHSPVVHTPQVGRAMTTKYLSAAFHVFINESFHYTREIVGGHDAVLEFQVDIDGISVNGVDMMKWDDEGKIIEFKVMVRPLKAVHLIQQKMGALLQAEVQLKSAVPN